ncbi:MAG TPA: MBL fold metallo-hydrolase [Candidatus Solibacter sp.]|nr:MBL fold metallo-hydrolase [Candidatus Solibacter sp.]
MPKGSLAVLLTLALIPLVTAATQAPAAPNSPASKTQVVILGTGTPVADPDTSGPAVAIVVNDAAYLVDCGPGVVRRAAAAERKGVSALKVTNIKVVFITHLHSDHTLGYPDLIFSPWVLGRKEPLESYGPRGLQDMTDYIEKAWEKDIDVRTNGLEHGNRTGYKVHVHEIQPGIIFKDANVTVTTFLVAHGSWDQAFGYRFDTADRSVVLSGDTAPTDAVVKACHGCDVLLHEVYNEVDPSRSADWLKYLRAFHTSTFQLAKIAIDAKPGLLVLYHQGYGHPTPEAQILREINERYSGKVAYAHDLDAY